MNHEKTKRAQIIEIAIEILENEPGGLARGEIYNLILDKEPDLGPRVNLYTALSRDNLKKFTKDRIIEPEPGILRFKYAEKDVQPEITDKEKPGKYQERDFYEPFAEWLKTEGECTEAKRLGESKLPRYWGTPDVIGVWKTPRFAPKESYEIVSAEVKIDNSTSSLLTGFAQACCYKLFSHKAYLVIPNKTRADVVKRLTALCMSFRIGLILFDAEDAEDPKWEIKTRAARTEPHMFYLNEFLVQEEVKELFR